MSNGRPFRDNTFKPNGRPFIDEGFKLNGRPFRALRSKIDELMVELEELNNSLDSKAAEDVENLANNLKGLKENLKGLREDTNEELKELEGEDPEDADDELEELQEKAEEELEDLEDDLEEIEKKTDRIKTLDKKGINQIIGTQGDDILTGSDANDNLIGKKGDDILTGGLGRDKFKPGKGDDVIKDFEIGFDRLLGKFKDAVLSTDGENTLLLYKKGSVLFEGLDIEQVETLL